MGKPERHLSNVRFFGPSALALDAVMHEYRRKAPARKNVPAAEVLREVLLDYCERKDIKLHRYRCSGCGAVLGAPHCPKHGETTVERLEEDEK